MLQALGTFSHDDYLAYGLSMLTFFVLPFLVYEWRVERKGQLLYLLGASLKEKIVLYGYWLLMLLVFPPLAQQVFIYFQF